MVTVPPLKDPFKKIWGLGQGRFPSDAQKATPNNTQSIMFNGLVLKPTM